MGFSWVVWVCLIYSVSKAREENMMWLALLFLSLSCEFLCSSLRQGYYLLRAGGLRHVSWQAFLPWEVRLILYESCPMSHSCCGTEVKCFPWGHGHHHGIGSQDSWVPFPQAAFWEASRLIILAFSLTPRQRNTVGIVHCLKDLVNDKMKGSSYLTISFGFGLFCFVLKCRNKFFT